MTDVLVSFDDVTRHHVSGANIVFALKEVTCKVVAGHHIAVTGASGSGKSSLLAHMAGLDSPNFGRVTWPTLPSLMPVRPKYSSVSFQSPSLLPSLTILQNVEVPLLILGQDQVQERANGTLEHLGIAHLGERFPIEVSGGQAQRAALARAMVTNPRLLLADEPTGQLDQETGHAVIDYLFDWADRVGSTLVVATHDPQVSKRFKQQWNMSFGVLSNGNE